MMEVELPDGTVLELPDGTTPAQAQTAARSYLARAGRPSGAAKSPVVGQGSGQGARGPVEGAGGAAFGVTPSSGIGRPTDPGGAEKFRKGFANSGIETYLGAKQLFKDLDKEEMSVLQQSRQDVDEAGGWGGVGRVSGGVLQALAGGSLVPGKISAVKGILNKSLAAGATSGLSATAFTPVENQDDKYTEKVKEGGKAAAAGFALQGTLSSLAKAGTGAFKPTPDAQKLMNQGVYPTLAQGAESKIGRTLGGLAFDRKGVSERQAEEVLDALTERATAGKADLHGGTIAERMGIIDDVISKDRDAVTAGKKAFVTNTTRQSALAQARSIIESGGRNTREADKASEILENVIGTDKNTVRMGFSKFQKDYLNRIQEEIGDHNPNLTNEALIRAKNTFLAARNSRLTADEISQLKDIDSRYFDLMRLKEAAAGSAKNDTGVPINALADKYARGPGMDKFGAHNETNEELIAPAYRTLKSESENAARGKLLNTRRALAFGTLGTGAAVSGAALPTAIALAPVYATSMASQTKGGARALFGDYAGQKAFKASLESPQTKEITLANILRAIRDNSAAAGAGLTVGE